MRNTILLLLTTLALGSCDSGNTADSRPARLPIAGNFDIRPNPNGTAEDTIHYPVKPFALTDQAGQPVNNQTLAGRAYVIDFFFATCPGICPKLQGQMLKVYKNFAADPRVAFVSVTIDPDHDTTAVLLDYAQRLGARDATRWHFGTTGGSREQAMLLANQFFAAAMVDKQAPGGMAHDGTLALVDDRGFVRGAYDGLNAAKVAELQRDIPRLLQEIAERKKQ